MVLPSHLQQIHAALVADRVGIEPHTEAELRPAEDYQRFTDEHA